MHIMLWAIALEKPKDRNPSSGFRIRKTSPGFSVTPLVAASLRRITNWIQAAQIRPMPFVILEHCFAKKQICERCIRMETVSDKRRASGASTSDGISRRWLLFDEELRRDRSCKIRNQINEHLSPLEPYAQGKSGSQQSSLSQPFPRHSINPTNQQLVSRAHVLQSLFEDKVHKAVSMCAWGINAVSPFDSHDDEPPVRPPIKRVPRKGIDESTVVEFMFFDVLISCIRSQGSAPTLSKYGMEDLTLAENKSPISQEARDR
ncbi:hypothetical protein F2P81_020528 [Scophthalmus maximus]|uniref:Uncharacterized protein n=1 Tax=Scophthalmus maximus TaxID=52904 RepID=A0A6A4S428_SCOMX|nr:hypothetical protein F2P81_020528 [Scophthalmus maximus]